MAKTFIEVTSDGVATQVNLNFAFGIGKREFISVYSGLVTDVDVAENQIPFLWINDDILELSAPVPDGEVYFVRRVIPRDELANDYSNGAIVQDDNLDTSFAQLLMIFEEIEDGFSSDLGESNFLNNVNMNNFLIRNVRTGEELGDAVNLAQLQGYSVNWAQVQAAVEVFANAAAASANEAMASAIASANSATNADASASESSGSAQAAQIYVNITEAYKNQAYTYSQEAEASAEESRELVAVENYKPASQYQINDMVGYNGVVYTALQATSNNTPANGTFWTSASNGTFDPSVPNTFEGESTYTKQSSNYKTDIGFGVLQLGTVNQQYNVLMAVNAAGDLFWQHSAFGSGTALIFRNDTGVLENSQPHYNNTVTSFLILDNGSTLRNAPPTFSVSRTGPGNYILQHNLNDTRTYPQATARTSDLNPKYASTQYGNPNAFRVSVTQPDGTFIDGEVTVMMAL